MKLIHMTSQNDIKGKLIKFITFHRHSLHIFEIKIRNCLKFHVHERKFSSPPSLNFLPLSA